MASGLVVRGMWISDFNRYGGFGLPELNSGFQSQGFRIQTALNNNNNNNNNNNKTFSIYIQFISIKITI